jgi:hypothetical protein
VQKMAKAASAKGVIPGRWFSPSVTGAVLRNLTEDSKETTKGLRVYVSEPANVCIEDVTSGFEKKNWRPLLLIIPMLLGGPPFADPDQLPALCGLFQLKAFLGIVGGRPYASYFFVGCCELPHPQGLQTKLIYLDPHTLSQPAFTSNQTAGSLHETELRMMDISGLDNSCLLGFYCHTEQEFRALMDDTEKLFKDRKQNLFYWYKKQSSPKEVVVTSPVIM